MIPTAVLSAFLDQVHAVLYLPVECTISSSDSVVMIDQIDGTVLTHVHLLCLKQQAYFAYNSV